MVISDEWDITRAQMAGLNARFNLSDAHNRMELSPGLARHFADGGLVDLWRRAETLSYHKVLASLIESMSGLLGDAFGALDQDSIDEAYASSVCMNILAGSIADAGYDVALVEPTFDNIHDLLALAGVKTVPFPDAAYSDGDFEMIGAKVVFVVSPNNPTGTVLEADRMRDLFRWAEESERVVCIDRSFALFDERPVDVYAIASEFPSLGLICIEDTGKIFPSLDQKVGLLVNVNPAARSMEVVTRAIQVRRSALLLNVSPLTLCVVTAFLKDAQRGEGIAHVRSALQRNRAALTRVLSPMGFVSVSTGQSSVQLLDVSALPFPTAQKLVECLRRDVGVHVLAGDKFFWSTPNEDSGLIRLALARNSSYFNEAIELVANYVARSTGRAT